MALATMFPAPASVVETQTREVTIIPDPPARRRAGAPADPVATLRARHAEAGLHITARTGLPLWLGERLDLGYALDVLRPVEPETGARFCGTRHVARATSHPRETEYDRARRARGR